MSENNAYYSYGKILLRPNFMNESVLVDFFRAALLPLFAVILTPLLPDDIADLLVAPASCEVRQSPHQDICSHRVLMALDFDFFHS